MSKSLPDISDKIDESTKQLFVDFTELASDVDCFVAGATARDMLMAHLHEIAITRASADVDMGIQLESWAQFEQIKTRLLSSGKFSDSPQLQRVVHQTGLPLDLVPFGGLATSAHKIEWPPENDPQMSIIGYDDARNAAQKVRISQSPILEIQVATPQSVVFPKLIAWADEPARRSRDVDDILYIFRHYLDLDNWDRLLDEHRDLTEEEDFDVRSASARLIGRDIAQIASPATIEAVSYILDSELSKGESSRLLQEMMSRSQDQLDITPRTLLESLRKGLDERSK